MKMDDIKKNTCKPFLRWAGGKTRSIAFLINHLPPNFNLNSKARYFEPFLGAGSLFFNLNPHNAFLSDKNTELIQCYRAIKNNPELVSKYLIRHLEKNSKDYYYDMRIKYNSIGDSIYKSALFIYLNKACFNGIWRVNSIGNFNVPYGYKEKPSLPTNSEILNIHKSLQGVDLKARGYSASVANVKKDDFVYFDPPYPPLNGTSYFTHYTKIRFSKADHKTLSQIAKKLSLNGAFILISNSDTEYIRSLYKKEDGFNIHELEVTRWIRTDGKRYKVNEVAITNY